MKKSLIQSSILISTLLFSGIDTEAASFSDVTSNGREIDYLSGQGIINGYADGTFRPYQPLKRIQAVQMLMRDSSIVKPDVVPPNPGFKDMKPGDYGYDDIAMAVHLGIISGKENPKTKEKYFDPWGQLTRAQMAKILIKTYKVTGEYDSEFRDVTSSYWAYEDINALAAHNIAIGYQNNDYKPNESITRNHFVLFMARTKEESFRPQFQEVIFNEEVIEKEIRKQLDKPTGKITSYNMGGITDLPLLDQVNHMDPSVDDFTGLEYAINLKSLSVRMPFDQAPTDLSILKGLPKLESLVMVNMENEDLEPLYALKELRHLGLSGVVNENQLRGLTNLKSLDVLFELENVEVLTSLTNLEVLRISVNLEDVSTLSTLKNLKSLEFWIKGHDQLDLNQLKSFDSLSTLKMSAADAANLQVLNDLHLSSVQLTDVKDLESIRGIKAITKLSIEGNFEIKDLESTLLSFPSLKEVYVSVPNINGIGASDEAFIGPYRDLIQKLEKRGVQVNIVFPVTQYV